MSGNSNRYNIPELLLAWASFAILGACAPSLIGSGTSSGTGVTDAMIQAQTLPIAAQFGSSAIGSILWNDYVRRCTGGANACSGVTDGVTACTGAETGGATACLHVGDHFKVTTTITTCSGVSMTDKLGVFDWDCRMTGGVAVFYSQIKSTKGLKDLISGTSWLTESVTITNGSATKTSTESAWWNNTIRSITPNNGSCTVDAGYSTCPGVANTLSLNLASTIFTIAAGSVTNGININGDKIAVVVTGTGPVLGQITGNNCSTTTFEVVAGTKCLLAVGTQNFVWIEGAYSGNQAAGNLPFYALGLTSMKFSRVHLASFGNTGDSAIYFYGSNNNNRFSSMRLTGTSTYGLFAGLTGINTGNIFWGINISSTGNSGIHWYGQQNYSVLQDVTLLGGTEGMLFRAAVGDDQTKVILSRATTANHQSGGVVLWANGGTLSDILLHNIVATNTNGSASDSGIMLEGAISGGNLNTPTLSQIVSASNPNATGGLVMNTVNNGKITGNLLVGNNTGANCTVSAGTNPAMTGACAAQNASNNSVVTGVDLSASFALEVASDSSNGSESGIGEAVGNTIAMADWFTFSNSYRAWTRDTSGGAWPHTSKAGACNYGLGVCQIFDFSLASAASVIRNTTGSSGGSLTSNGSPGSTCPSAAAGSQYLTSQTYTYDASYFAGFNGVEISGGDGDGVCEAGETCAQRYLQAASEIIDDLSGDDDGLCETGERCIYNPNFGAYQGHGTLSSCTFTDGTITGVTMFYYSTNGY